MKKKLIWLTLLLLMIGCIDSKLANDCDMYTKLVKVYVVNLEGGVCRLQEEIAAMKYEQNRTRHYAALYTAYMHRSKTSLGVWGISKELARFTENACLDAEGTANLPRQLDTVDCSPASTNTSTSTTPAASARPTQPATPKPAWEYRVSKDETTGKETGSLTSRSRNILTGWLKSDNVDLSYICGRAFVVSANDLGFSTNNIDCGSYYCTHVHYARVRFDDGPTTHVTFEVSEDNNDHMYLQTDNSVAYFVSHMKAGQQMHLELELFQTDGNQQIAVFDLTGFTKAYNSCP